jgi:RNA polymerase sigma-70 factor (ECF subfamily)
MIQKRKGARTGWQEERRLLADLKKENAKACQRFLTEHGETLYRLAYRLCGDEEQALQWTTDGLAQALLRSGFRQESQELGPWLAGFILRQAMPAPATTHTVDKADAPVAPTPADTRTPPRQGSSGHERRRRRREHTPAPSSSKKTVPAEPSAPAAPLVDWSPLIEAPESRLQLRQRLLASAAHLPAELRSAWVLMDAEGRTMAQAAAVLELNISTVTSRLHRARLALRQALSAPVTPDGETT